MSKLFLAFELNVQEEFEAERHRSVFFHPDDPDKVFYVAESENIDILIRNAKARFADHDLLLLDHGHKGKQVVHAGRWGLATVLKLYGGTS